jgi:hypothetical protein
VVDFILGVAGVGGGIYVTLGDCRHILTQWEWVLLPPHFLAGAGLKVDGAKV